MSRAASFVVDLFAMGLLWLFTDSTFELAASFFGFNRFPLTHAFSSIVARVSELVLVAAYFPACWLATGGRTIGKMIFGLRIVCVDGRPLRLGTCIVRELAYWVSAVPFCLGFLWIVADHDRRAWHDKLSGTRVVYDER